jgi:hypothetical protein
MSLARRLTAEALGTALSPIRRRVRRNGVGSMALAPTGRRPLVVAILRSAHRRCLQAARYNPKARVAPGQIATRSTLLRQLYDEGRFGALVRIELRALGEIHMFAVHV